MAKVDLVNVPEPDLAELWFDSATGKWYIVYNTPDDQYDFWLMYEVTDPKAIVPPGVELKADRTGTLRDFLKLGGLNAGKDVELSNFTEHPFTAWESLINRQAEVRPWLRDEEVLALLAEALLEGRELTEAEFQTTNWWRSHNAAERQWLLTVESDPKEAERLLSQNRIIIGELLKEAGINNASQEVIRWLSNQYTQGRWDSTYLNAQIKAMSDPYSGIRIDTELSAVIGNQKLDVTRAEEDTVRSMVAAWLGPTFGKWGEQEIARWAGRLRNDPDAQIELEEFLKKQRLALLPEYENPNLTYQDIAAPWKNFVTSEWGQIADETDPLFTKILKLNDSAEAGKLLRQEGLKRGIGKVLQDITAAIGQAQGGGVRRAI